MSDQTLYLKCGPGDIAARVLLSGDPARVDRAAALLGDVRHVGHNREFSVATGTFRGTPVSIVSGGIGAPSTAIAIEELVQVGAKAIVRVGTMMGIGTGAPLGTVVLSTGAVRGEGTSQRYLPAHYPAIPDWTLVQALRNAAQAAGLDTRLGMTATYDAFYPDMAPSLIGAGELELAEARRANVLAMDMESSLVFVLGALRGIATAAMCLITVQAEPHRHLDPPVRADGDRRLIEAALTGLAAFEVT